MSNGIIRTILVTGDNPDEQIKKYSATTNVEKHIKAKISDASKMHKSHLAYLKEILNSDKIKLNEDQKTAYQELYYDLSDMDDNEYFMYITDGCEYDPKTGDALTTDNPNAKFLCAKCYQHWLDTVGEEGPMSTPFKLKDGKLSYSARKVDIDWTKMHMYNTDIYKSAWEIVVENREPKNEQEKYIKDNMSNRIAYFINNFRNCDEYVTHSCSFWSYGIIYDGNYIDVDMVSGDTDRDEEFDKKWVRDFYSDFIEKIPEDTLLTLYEARSLD